MKKGVYCNIQTEVKRCTKCNEFFPKTTEYFYVRNKKKPELGMSAECKKCMISAASKRQEENKERVSRYKKRYYIRNKDIYDKRHANYRIGKSGYFKQKGKEFRESENGKERLKIYQKKKDKHIIYNK